jgi:hypothetical protein
MKQRTDEEIRTKVKELWPNVNLQEGRWSNTDYFRIARRDNYIDITIAQMYEAPGLSFAQLQALAEFFDTLKVETEEEIHEDGCESCDYGSRRGFVLRISEGAPFVALNS